MARPDDKDSTTQTPSVVYVPATPSSSSGGVSILTLVVLLIASSILSSALSPLMQTGLRRAAEIYLGIPPNAKHVLHHQRHHGFHSQHPPQSDPVQQAQQPVVQKQQESHVPLAKRVKSTDKDGFQCVHNYRNYIIHRDPLVIYLEDFLQPGEADHMISVASPKMVRSRVVGEKKHSESRTSSSAYLSKSADHVISCIEERASLFTNISIESTEPLQVVWYTEGQEFRPHHDYLKREDLKGDYWSRWGQRYVTILVYLNEPEHGGSTIFPKLDLDFKPKKNDAIFWYNVGIDEKEDDRTLHGGEPVKGGEKYAINIWQRKMLPGLEPFIQKDSDSNANADQPPKYSTPSDEKAEEKVDGKGGEEVSSDKDLHANEL